VGAKTPQRYPKRRTKTLKDPRFMSLIELQREVRRLRKLVHKPGFWAEREKKLQELTDVNVVQASVIQSLKETIRKISAIPVETRQALTFLFEERDDR
jgi:hypothetical protein